VVAFPLDISKLQLRAAVRAVDAPAPLRLWHLASLDAPTVAAVWGLAFAWAAHTALPRWVPLLLALVTFAVYVADRLLDTRRAMRTGHLHTLRHRHTFHWRHRRALIPLAAIAAVAAACLIFSLMPAINRARNSVLAAAALMYFSGVHGVRQAPVWLRRVFSKELLVGLLFTAGCALPTLSRLGATWPTPLLTAIAYFATLAWLNCHAIEAWESTPRTAHTLRFGVSLAACGALLAVFFHADPRVGTLLAAGAASALLLALLDSLRAHLTPLALRTAADLVLLTPLVLVLR
jgi:hypothetical protein